MKRYVIMGWAVFGIHYLGAGLLGYQAFTDRTGQVYAAEEGLALAEPAAGTPLSAASSSDEITAEDADAQTVQRYSRLSNTLQGLRSVRSAAQAAALPEVPLNQRAGGVPPPSVDQADILKVQQQIQHIMTTNQRFKSLHEEQLAKIRDINDQSAIHRRILDELQKHKGGGAEYTPTDTEEILRQEKLRLIQQTAEENQDYLFDLEKSQEQALDR